MGGSSWEILNEQLGSPRDDDPPKEVLRNGRGDPGPRRPKAPPKEYAKPKWAAGNEEGEAAEVMKVARLILNKLTVEKFERLSDDFLKAGFTSVALLEGAIDIIVDKAQVEQHFGAMYADLCLKMARTPIEGIDDVADGKGKQFKKSLLQRCQGEFEKDMTVVLAELEQIPDEGDRAMAILQARKR